ncbi:MAG: preprotein translocase subunit YajC [Acidobacteriota bacterium]|jgi:preprotein translocase subunit YajC|nr:preprotein translocase subunit YajC [Acidobacteriota bacterium]
MNLFAQGAGPAAQPSMISALIPFIIIFVIFYLLIIMPARKKQKKHQEMLGAIKGGERVVTAGGIFGTVTRVMDDRVELEVDKNTRIQVAKSSVSSVIQPGGNAN